MTNSDKADHPMLPHVRIAVTVMMTLLILVMLVSGAVAEEHLKQLLTIDAVHDELRAVELIIWEIEFGSAADSKTEEQSEDLQKLQRLRELLQELLRKKVEVLMAKAGQGDAWRQLELCVMYREGKVAPQDDKQAVYWCGRADEQRVIAPVDVQFPLLLMVLDRSTDARDWMAERGHAAVQFDLGGFYYRDDSVFKDHRQAVYWYRKSAEQGYARAQAMLGVMYMTGSGVPEDDIQAYAWFNLAAAQGIEQAKEGKTILRQQMIPAQVAEAQALSRELAARIEAGQ